MQVSICFVEHFRTIDSKDVKTNRKYRNVYRSLFIELDEAKCSIDIDIDCFNQVCICWLFYRIFQKYFYFSIFEIFIWNCKRDKYRQNKVHRTISSKSLLYFSSNGVLVFLDFSPRDNLFALLATKLLLCQ